MNVSVVGLWHLGCVTAGCLARLGHDVTGVDDDPQRIASLREGRAPLFEPGLDDLLKDGMASGKLAFATRISQTVPRAHVVVIAHDTPLTEQDEADTSVIVKAVREAARALRPPGLILVHSQIPVGTCRRLREMLDAVRPGAAPLLAYMPENLRLGQAIERFLRPDVVVVGAEDARAHEIAESLLAGIPGPKIRTNLVTAEMAKHAINAFLATSISFGNELANLSQAAGADGTQIASILHAERRIGPRVPLDPGMGFAGGTLARDMRILQGLGETVGYQPTLIDAVLEVNAQQNLLPLRWLERMYGALSGLRVGVLGLTYKAGTSTLRRSAAVEIIDKLVTGGVTVTASDPKADITEARELPRFELTRDHYAAASEASALLLLTPWPEFAELDYGRIKTRMRHPVILDMHNLLDRTALERLGFLYVGVGRGALVPHPRS